MAGVELCDARTLEALDFASVQNRVVSATRTQRGKGFALEMTPHTDFDRVRVEQARTAATRELVAGSDLHVMNAIDTADLTQAAALTRTLGTSELRAIGDAIAAAAAAYNATHESEELRPLLAGYLPLRELHRALTGAIDERGVVLDRASPRSGVSVAT